MSCRVRACEGICLAEFCRTDMSCRVRACEGICLAEFCRTDMSCRVRACEEVARNSTGYYKVSHRAREVTP